MQILFTGMRYRKPAQNVESKTPKFNMVTQTIFKKVGGFLTPPGTSGSPHLIFFNMLLLTCNKFLLYFYLIGFIT